MAFRRSFVLASFLLSGVGFYNSIVRQFFDLLREQKSAVAVDYVFGTNPVLKQQIPQIVQVKSQFGGIEPLLGELRSYDVVVSKVVAGRYAYVYALANYEGQPLKIEFVFHKPKDVWRVVNFVFNTDFVADLRAMAWADEGVGEGPGRP
jgi:hypothetical protein